MKSNEVLKKKVLASLKFEPVLNKSEIGVSVKDGIITLSGTVNSLTKKIKARKTVKKVEGVMSVLDYVEVIVDEEVKKADGILTEDLNKCMENSLIFPKGSISVKINQGWVTLSGTVKWNFQRELAEEIVEHILGVKGLINNIQLKCDRKDLIEKEMIQKAFRRHWCLDADDIKLEVHGSVVELRGFVRSLFQKEEAERIVYKTPGVEIILNFLEIDFEQPYLC